jgi:hypothetical protein
MPEPATPDVETPTPSMPAPAPSMPTQVEDVETPAATPATPMPPGTALTRWIRDAVELDWTIADLFLDAD